MLWWSGLDAGLLVAAASAARDRVEASVYLLDGCYLTAFFSCAKHM